MKNFFILHLLKDKILSSVRTGFAFRSSAGKLLVLALLFGLTAPALCGQTRDLSAVVLVNSANPTGYNPDPAHPGEYQRYPERYLEHLQIPYRVVDVSTTPAQASAALN